MSRHLTSGLDRSACLGLLGTRSWGRLVYTRRALPEVLPVAYSLQGERVLLGLAPDSEAARASRDAVVAFEVDDFDDAFTAGWTVTIVGLAREMAGQGSLTGAPANDDQVLAVTVDRMSGHRLTSDKIPASASWTTFS